MLPLAKAELLARAAQRDEKDAAFLSPETLVYFIRRAVAAGDRLTLNPLFRQLLERCAPFVCGWARGFDAQTRSDIVQQVMKKVAEDLLKGQSPGQPAPASASSELAAAHVRRRVS